MHSIVSWWSNLLWMEKALYGIGIASLIIELIAVWGRDHGKPTSTWWTISQVFRRDGRHWLAIPYGWGVLMGHLFGFELPYRGWMSYALIASGVGVLGRDIWRRTAIATLML